MLAVPAEAAIDISGSCNDAPREGMFMDLDGVPDAAVDAIACVVTYGVSTGVTPSTFDPFAEVERWQMALFLTRQLSAHGMRAALPAGANQAFVDLAGVPAAAVTSINQIAELGISTGTTPSTFDPFAKVERWQMALFLTRLIDIVIDDNSSTDDDANNLPAGSDQGFADLGSVPAAAAAAINQIAQLGVADGTAATTFTPFAEVERWQMALFLARTLAMDEITATDPFLMSSTIVDTDASGSITAGDVIALRFNEEMDRSTPEKSDLTVSDGTHVGVLDQQLPNVAWAWDATGTVLTGIVTADSPGPVMLPAVISGASGGRHTDLHNLSGRPMDASRGDLTLERPPA